MEELIDDLNTDDMIMKRIQYCANRCNQDPKYKIFLLGWVNRCVDLWNYEVKDDIG
jgi:hypothetical protein